MLYEYYKLEITYLIGFVILGIRLEESSLPLHNEPFYSIIPRFRENHREIRISSRCNKVKNEAPARMPRINECKIGQRSGRLPAFMQNQTSTTMTSLFLLRFFYYNNTLILWRIKNSQVCISIIAHTLRVCLLNRWKSQDNQTIMDVLTLKNKAKIKSYRKLTVTLQNKIKVY